MAGLRRLPAWERALGLARARALEELAREVPEGVWRRGQDLGHEILFYDTAPRAMDLLRRRVGDGLGSGAMVGARSLSGARGRLGRPWWAPRGGLWFALAIYDDLLPESRGWLPVAFGLAVTRALRLLGAGVWLRWVNDVHLGGRKVAGLLAEEVCVGGERWVLLGVGVNVNNPLPAGLFPAASLRGLLGRRLSLTALFGRLVKEMVRFYGMLRAFEAEGEGGEHPLHPWFLRLSDTPGRRVVFGQDLSREPEGEGVVLGLSEGGELLLETPEGARVLLGGEIRYLD